MEEVPDLIGKLSQLIKLDLSSNKLKTVPPSFDKLVYLEILDLSNN
jgi:Leucine-rich repeat (LRR) protein